MHRGIFDNGMVGVLYDPAMWLWYEKPCWNWVQVEYLGDNKIALRLLFRSHDYGTGMWANLSFILFMMRYFIAKPCNCEIVEVTLFSSNAHIYRGDADNAEKVSGIPWLREEKESVLGRLRRWLKR
jgi:thymidylate synthase